MFVAVLDQSLYSPTVQISFEARSVEELSESFWALSTFLILLEFVNAVHSVTAHTEPAMRQVFVWVDPTNKSNGSRGTSVEHILRQR